MRKEVVFAIVFGILIGLIFAFGIFRINGVMKQRSSTITSDNIDKVRQTSADTNIPDSPLTLLKPNNMQVFGNDIIQITGTTKAENYIVATGGTRDLITKSGNNGSFDFEYEIDPSLNYLNISSISVDNYRSDTKLEVVYSSEVLKKDPSNSGNMEDRIEEKLDNAQKIAVFYKGTITDITDNNMQMKTSSDEIKQISYATSSTTFAKIGKTTTKITASDIAIGDYILTLGYKNDNGVLEAFRIIVTQPSVPEGIKIFYGTVSQKNKSDMEISEQNSQNVIIEIDNNSKTYKGELSDPVKVRFADIKEGDTVIGTYTIQKDVNIIRRIHILNNKT